MSGTLADAAVAILLVLLCVARGVQERVARRPTTCPRRSPLLHKQPADLVKGIAVVISTCEFRPNFHCLPRPLPAAKLDGAARASAPRPARPVHCRRRRRRHPYRRRSVVLLFRRHRERERKHKNESGKAGTNTLTEGQRQRQSQRAARARAGRGPESEVRTRGGTFRGGQSDERSANGQGRRDAASDAAAEARAAGPRAWRGPEESAAAFLFFHSGGLYDNLRSNRNRRSSLSVILFIRTGTAMCGPSENEKSEENTAMRHRTRLRKQRQSRSRGGEKKRKKYKKCRPQRSPNTKHVAANGSDEERRRRHGDGGDSVGSWISWEMRRQCREAPTGTATANEQCDAHFDEAHGRTGKRTDGRMDGRTACVARTAWTPPTPMDPNQTEGPESSRQSMAHPPPSSCGANT